MDRNLSQSAKKQCLKKINNLKRKRPPAQVATHASWCFLMKPGFAIGKRSLLLFLLLTAVHAHAYSTESAGSML